MADDQFIRHESCPNCSSTNNLAVYSDHAYCFGCKYREEREDGEETDGSTRTSYMPPKNDSNVGPLGSFEAIKARGISAETCLKMKYSIGEYQGQKAHIVNVPDQKGNIVAQKVRLKGKQFRFYGDTKSAGLVFQDIWPAGGKKIVVTEGEIDALTICFLQENKYGAVSVPNGCAGALESCKRSYTYLNSFDEIIIMFDMDDVGKAAATTIAQLFGPKAKIASLPEKDANECLLKGNGKAVISAIWNATPYRPDGIVAISSMRKTLHEEVQNGKPWIYEQLTKATYGRRKGELYFIGAGSGIGKSDFVLQQAEADMEDGDGVAMFMLEQPVKETTKRLCGKQAKRLFHIPDITFKEEELDAAFDAISQSNNAFLYDHFGSKDWETIRDNIRWLAVTEGVEHFYIDHLTALVSHELDERKALERITAEMSGLAQELGIYMYVISHLATPEGKPHEEGGRVMARHFKGARAIAFWAHFMFGLERDTQHEDTEIRQTTTFRVLKDRFTGKSTGLTFYLGYESDTGILYEMPVGWKPPKTDKAGNGFKSEDF